MEAWYLVLRFWLEPQLHEVITIVRPALTACSGWDMMPPKLVYLWCRIPNSLGGPWDEHIDDG